MPKTQLGIYYTKWPNPPPSTFQLAILTTFTTPSKRCPPVSPGGTRGGPPGGTDLRDQRQLSEARAKVQTIQGEEEEDHQKTRHQVGHKGRQKPGV